MRKLFAVALFFAPSFLAAGASPQEVGSYSRTMEQVLSWTEYAAVLGVGWGVGVALWIVSVHKGGSLLLSDSPRAWRLWRKGMASPLLMFKYFVGSILLFALGAAATWQLVGFWTPSFDTGLWVGGATGLLWTVREIRASA